MREMIEVGNDDSLEESGWKKIIRQAYVFTNVHEQSESCLVDIQRGYLNPKFDFAALRLVFDDKRELASYCAERVKLAEFVYNPLATGTFSVNSSGGEQLNLYQPPKWKHASYFTNAQLPQSPSAAPVLIDRYLNHLCNGDLPSKEYILDWLCTALKGRNYTILTAIGKPGIGKGRLGDIMGKLVGDSNFTKVRDSVFKAKFNAPLKNKQIVYVDEVAIKNTEEANRIKDVVNQFMEIERKGVDAEHVENHASFYLTSNQMDAVKIDAGDRRFSIIQLTDASLLTQFSPAQIEELSSDSVIAELALFLLARKPAHNMFFPFRSQRFDEVKEAGLSEWELWLIEEFFANQAIGTVTTLEQIKVRLRENFPYFKQPPGRLKIQDLVEKYPKILLFGKKAGIRSVEVVGKAEK